MSSYFGRSAGRLLLSRLLRIDWGRARLTRNVCCNAHRSVSDGGRCALVTACGLAEKTSESDSCGSNLLGILAMVAACTTAVTFCAEAEDTKNKIFRRRDVERHSTEEEGVWVTYRDGVYDVTSFLANHPGNCPLSLLFSLSSLSSHVSEGTLTVIGGRDMLLQAAGKDLTSLWRLLPYQQHFRSPLAFELLEEMRIGSLHPEDIILLERKDWEKRRQTHSSSSADTKYDCIIVGAGLSGLQTAHDLIHKHHVDAQKVLVLEAQDYVGGRVRQMSSFIKG